MQQLKNNVSKHEITFTTSGILLLSIHNIFKKNLSKKFLQKEHDLKTSAEWSRWSLGGLALKTDLILQWKSLHGLKHTQKTLISS